MTGNKTAGSTRPDSERRRRKREGVMMVCIIVVVALLTFVEHRVVKFGVDIPVSNTILMFILININLLLLILLIFLVFRNLVKLYHDRRHKVMGAKLRTRLVVAFITLTLLPSTVLFFFSINFIAGSIAFWFNVPVETTLEKSINVGRAVYEHIEENSRFFLERTAYQIKTRKLLAPEKKEDLKRYVQVVQREFNFSGVEVYGTNAQRITFALDPDVSEYLFQVVPADALLEERGERGVRRLTERTHEGELVRTVATVPFGAVTAEAKGFVVMTELLSSDVSENLTAISRGYGEYQQIKLMKKPIQLTYYIALSIVGLLVVFCAVWFAFYLAKTITIPIMQLSEGTRRIAEGDLNFRVELAVDDEIGTLVDSFNKMTRDLGATRDKLARSDRMLRKRTEEIEERRQYMEIVLKNVSAGVISFDPAGIVTTINKSAERMLAIKADDVLAKSYGELLSEQQHHLVVEMREKIEHSGDGVVLPLSLTIEGRPRSFAVHVNRLRDDAGNSMGLVMVFDDMTELEKAQRMAAWREVARRIAHEVKNPLTPITLSAQRLKRKYGKTIEEPVFLECTDMIIDHVSLIRNLVNEFATFARFPAADPKPCSLPSIIEETVALYREGHRNIDFKMEMAGDLPSVRVDNQQMKQAMINLIDNAIAAIKNEGEVQITLTHDPILKMIRLEVADSGKGISDEEKTRLFEPYFSTKKTGMGLGLAIVNSIIADHNGMVRVQDNQPRGAKFVIELPA